MKKMIFISLMFTTNGLFAQNFDIEDLRFCLYSGLDAVDARILPKGFFVVSRQSDENPLRDNRWCLKNADSVTVCMLTRTEIGTGELISLETYSADVFSHLLNQFQGPQCKYKHTAVIDGQAVISFINGKEELKIRSGIQEEGRCYNYLMQMLPVKPSMPVHLGTRRLTGRTH